MSKQFKPMKGDDYDEKHLVYPLYASPKIDGLRCVMLEGKARSSTLKPFPNFRISDTLESFSDLLMNRDGELVVGPSNAPDVYSTSLSGITTKDKVVQGVGFHIFDNFTNPNAPFEERMQCLLPLPKQELYNNTHGMTVTAYVHPQKLCHSLEEWLAYEEEMLLLGYEGLMLKSRHGKYKYGRSTAREAIMVKVKRFKDTEATCIGFEEEMQNNNEAYIDELGRTKRSSSKENKVGKGILGKLICVTPEGVEFAVDGFTQAMKETLWATRDNLNGRLVKYKYFPHGQKEAPRHPKFLGFRDPIDL